MANRSVHTITPVTDYIAIAILAFFTGFGTALGTKLAANILDSLEGHAKKAIKKLGEHL